MRSICPICKKELNKKVYVSEIALEEYYLRCDNGCYYEGFTYGETKIQIFGGPEHYTSYTFTREEFEEVRIKINSEIDYWLENNRFIGKLIES